jgi:hypothetical protein
MNCAGNPYKRPNGSNIEAGDTYAAGVDATDYLDDAQNDLGCSSATMVNHATELDYDRFFWELYSDPTLDLGLADLLEIIDRAEPGTWQGSTTSPFPLQSPYWRLNLAADEYDAAHGTNIHPTFGALQSLHGVDR